MTQLDRVRDAERQIQRAARKRWTRRAAQREKTREALATGGVYAADSPQRVARYQARQASLERLRALHRVGRLPRAFERQMGATLDFADFPPSEVARRAGRPVARVVEFNGVGIQPEGIATGFLVFDRLLMTNHHVFQTASDARGMGANFFYERSERGVEEGIVCELDPDHFFVSDENLDFAIVGVKAKTVEDRTPPELGVATLIEATGKILKGQPVNIIQHPEGRPKQYATKNNRLIDLLDQEGFLQYETDTLRGSSGAPAYNTQWELIGLHHASIPATRNGQVLARNGGIWSEEMGDDEVQWIANEATRVSAIVAKLASLTLSSPAHQTILKSLLLTTVDPGDALPPAASSQEPVAMLESPPKVTNGNGRHSLTDDGATARPMTYRSESSVDTTTARVTHNHFHFTGPVTINIGSGATTVGLPESKERVLGVGEERAIRFDRNYKNRKGYDPKFLDPNGDIVVPTPTVVPARADELVLGKDGAPLVLKYHHFELVMNEPRRLMMWSAVNVDYDPRRKPQQGRKAFGTDKWVPDPRLPAGLQIFDADFYKPATNIDRGHIVRRDDNAWGDTPLEIEYANSDTFHWTNCTPQHEAFNQSTPGQNDRAYAGRSGIWGAFENHIQKTRRGRDTKCCILAGPVLADDDPSADFGEGPIQYPLRFWKVVCIADPDPEDEGLTLKTYGFILDQSDVVEEFGIERFDVGPFKKYQVSLKTITRESGVKFAQSLLAADQKK